MNLISCFQECCYSDDDIDEELKKVVEACQDEQEELEGDQAEEPQIDQEMADHGDQEKDR